MTTIVFYASSMGNTEAAAEYLANKLGGNAVPFSSADLVDLEAVDTVVFGSRVHAGSMHKGMLNFIRTRGLELSGCRTALFLCCLFDGEKAEAQLGRAREESGIGTAAYFVSAKKNLKKGLTQQFDEFADRIGTV